MATQSHSLLISAEEFLRMDFGPDRKFELVDGVIRMMTGGTVGHARIQARLIRHVGNALAGSACEAFGPDIGIRIDEKTVRYADVSIFCGKRDDLAFDNEKMASDPIIVFEVLSPSTSRTDQCEKLAEYQSLPSVAMIVIIEPTVGFIRTLQRTGEQGWQDSGLIAQTSLDLPTLGVSIPVDAIFSRR
ncbi:MAG: Uma2 family endonuclease [Sphingomonadaceae bacterium]